MATPGFFNANQYRDYPFLSRETPLEEDGWSSSASLSATELPQTCIVDFGAILRPTAVFTTGTHCIYLRSIRRDGSILEITLALSSMPYAYAITFSVDTDTAAEFNTQWVDSDVFANISEEIYTCEDAPVWSAYLVTGDLSPLLLQLNDGETLFFVSELWKILPGRIQNLANTQVQSIAIANTRRTTTSPTPGCDGEIITETVPETAHLVMSCMVGDIKFYEGYNCGMRYDLRDNALVISASPGAGDGEVCEEFQAYPDEVKPDGSQYYSGGPACSDIVKWINGVNATDLRITAGPGFNVTADADTPNTLIIERSLNASIICIDPALEEEIVSSSVAAASSSSASSVGDVE